MKSVIDYRITYAEFLIRGFQDKLRGLKEISKMPEELLQEKMIEGSINVKMLKIFERGGIK